MAESPYAQSIYPGAPTSQPQSQEAAPSYQHAFYANPPSGFGNSAYPPYAPAYPAPQLPDPNTHGTFHTNMPNRYQHNFYHGYRPAVSSPGVMFQNSPAGTTPTLPHAFHSNTGTFSTFDQGSNSADSWRSIGSTVDLLNYRPNGLWDSVPAAAEYLRQSQARLPPATNTLTSQQAARRNLEPFNHHTQYSNGRSSYQGLIPPSVPQTPSHQERGHPSRLAVGFGARPGDASPTQRSSHRRSFDRYAIELPQLSPGTPSNEVPRPVARPRRRVGHASFRSRVMNQLEHPNVPTTAELQKLRDKLRHFLPNELPEGTDTVCDICQKDFAVKYVIPSEEEEVAIQLPCKHYFGEHCINTWFDTCKKHKNKITCPMCRSALIEPRPREGPPPSIVRRDLLLTRIQSHRSASGDEPYLSRLDSPVDTTYQIAARP